MATKEENPVSVKELLDNEAHIGHPRHRRNPKMSRFIFETRNKVDIIDLPKTVQQIRAAVAVVRSCVAKRKSILFVATKRQAKAIVRECAESAGEFYVCERWLGGMLTNLQTIRQSVKTLERIEKRIASGGDGYTKKEMVLASKEQVKLSKNLSGIRAMRKIPGLLIIVDPGREDIAVAEANKLGIPIMALVDTNCDPDPIDYVIPCNDDALKSIKLVLSTLTQAVIDQKNEMHVAVVEENSSVDFSEGASEHDPEIQQKEGI